MFRSRVLPLLIVIVYKLLRATWRVTVIESAAFKAALKDDRSMVFAHWHGDEMAILYLLKPYRAAAITSTSKDGEIINGVVNLMGAKTARGSSTRGGVSALKGILRLARDGYRPSVAVDGPKGPYHKAKPGVFEIARLTKATIFPLAAFASRKHVFERSWNKTYLPLPFSRIVVVWGEPVEVGADEDSRSAGLAERLESALANAEQQARNLIATH